RLRSGGRRHRHALDVDAVAFNLARSLPWFPPSIGPATGAMISIQNLQVFYQTDSGSVHAVRGIDLDIKQGQFFTLLGPSGCGKTTTLRSVAGLETPQEGEIFVGDDLVYSSANRTVVPP